MRHQFILLDADGTLFDFEAASRAAFGAACRGFAPDLNKGAMASLLGRYHEINAAIWLELERGEIDKESLKTERFRRLFAAPGIEPTPVGRKIDPRAFGIAYLDSLSREAILLPGALDFVRELAARGHRPAIATNGVASVQRGRFAASPLADLVGELLISEELGAEKPARAFFEAAFARLGVSADSASRAVMIGDSWSADIEGALAFGMEAIWFNPGRAAPPRSADGLVDARDYEAVLAALDGN